MYGGAHTIIQQDPYFPLTTFCNKIYCPWGGSAAKAIRVVAKLGAEALDSEGDEEKDSEDSKEGKDGEEDEDSEGVEGGKERTEGSNTEGVDVNSESQQPRVSHAVSEVNGEDAVHRHKKHVLGAHVRKLMLNICTFSQAQDAKQIEPQFDDLGKPMYIVDGVLVPHLNRPFKLEWEAWGTKLVKLARDLKCMDMTKQDILLSASIKEIQQAVRTEKAENCKKALHSSGLDIVSFEAVVDPYFQLDEENDPTNKNCWIVKVPKYRTEDCTNFLVTLDVTYNGNKFNMPEINKSASC